MKKPFLLCALISVPAFAHDLSGVWKIDGSVADRPVAATCSFKQTDTNITGSCKMQESEKPLDVKGQIGDKKLSWKYDIVYQGTTYTLTFTGAPDSADTSIKGTISVDPSDASGDFTATKQ